MARIALNEVSKSYGSTVVIERLSLAMNDGEFICFLGPSGCGKSTLLRMIAGLEVVTDGTIAIDGERVDHMPPGKRGVAMVFQHYALYPQMTVFDNMAFGLRNVGIGKAEIESRIADAAEVLEIVPLLRRFPAQLSGGQRQRVAIGRALVKKPSAYLFDEPLSNLDAALRHRTRFELARLHQRTKATMIFVTHDQVEAMTLADRIVVMNNRKIEQVGTPIEIYEQPATKFVAQFVGAPPMNILTATVRGAAGGQLQLATADGLPIELKTSLKLNVGEQVEIGVRAEHLTLADGGAIRGTVQVFERLGDRNLMHVALPGGEVIVAAVPSSTILHMGDAVALDVAYGHLHLFDKAGIAHRTAEGGKNG